MCGFVGYVGAPLPDTDLKQARDLLAHRGPDASGLWTSGCEGAAVGLAFRRLRILDLSPDADQPMALGDLRLIYNGEIYNFRELRSELEAKGHRFRTTGDTEVVLAAYREWGTEAIRRLEGMFSLALWDGGRKRLLLARDRLGIKPLFYLHDHGRLLFASEPKSVLALASEPPELDRDSLAKFLTFLWVPDPDTLFRGMRKLPPGHFATFEDGELSVREYWDVPFGAMPGTLTEHVDRLREALRVGVRRQLVSDVPLGVFLSGGVDSTLLARLASEESSHPVLAIATGFDERTRPNEGGTDDLPYARVAARSISNIDYREIVLTASTVDRIDDLISYFDDPVADPAAIAAYLITAAAKPEATVMLSGVGAEELFGGYARHRAVAWASRLGKLPAGMRSALGWMGGAIHTARPGTQVELLRRVRKFMQGLADPEPYLAFCTHNDVQSLSQLLGHAVDWSDVVATHRRHSERVRGLPQLSQALYLDLKTYLPSLNLAYTDRASMAASVEVRVPVLDERVVEIAVQIPDEFKVHKGVGKYVLKEAARGLVPDEILSRPKGGFGGPVRTWMRDLPTETLRDALSRDTIKSRGWLDPDAVLSRHRELVEGRSDQALQLWAVVVLELWARRFLDRK